MGIKRIASKVCPDQYLAQSASRQNQVTLSTNYQMSKAQYKFRISLTEEARRLPRMGKSHDQEALLNNS